MYDSGPITRYDFGNQDLGGGSDFTFKVRGPKGKAGRIVDVGVYGVTEAFNGDTLDPKVKVGTLTDDDYYVDDFPLGKAAVDSGGKSLMTTYAPADPTLTGTYLLHKEIPADGVVSCVFMAATGANLTGHASCYIDIQWDL